MNNAFRPALVAVVLLHACAAATRTPTAPAGSPRPPSAAELFARGMNLAAHGDALRAEQYLLLARRTGYPERRLIVPLVRVCVASSRLRAALGHAEPYLRRYPGAWRLRYLTAAIHLALDQPREALRELNGILRMHPDAAQAHYLLAITLRDGLGDPAAARVSFEQYLHHAPRGAHAREALAWLAEHSGERTATAEPADHRAVTERGP